jgi:predicted ATPase/DNA-binding CsgD family transcriptional regulator
METAGSTETPLRNGRFAARPPVPLTSLLAREREIASVSALLRRDDVRLLTLTGAGGVGKTRLAIAVANELAGTFPDGISFVSLASVRQAELVPSAIAHALGIIESGAQAPQAALLSALRDPSMLLVLDNFEHILAAAQLVAELLAKCPGLTFLVTSRAPLHISGEWEFPVPPLALPATEALESRDVADAAAVRLFVERATVVDHTFALSDDNAAAVGAICIRLDGLPLAIELAAARSKALPPALLLPRLARRLPLLTGGPRDVPARLQTMREAIVWSHDLLTPDEQILFRRLAVFSGGFDLEAAEAVSGDVSPNTLDLIASLIDKSLLRWSEAPGGRRLGMLETVREFAEEQLTASGEEATARAAHADYFLTLAEQAEPGLFGPQQAGWFARLETELPNLRAAMNWLRDSGRFAQGLRLATALGWFWPRRNHNREGHQWLTLFLASAQGDETVRARALSMTTFLDFWLGEHAMALEHAAQSLTLCQQLGDRTGTAKALRDLGGAMIFLGDYARAEAVLAESLAAFDELDAPWDTAFLFEWLAILSYAHEDYATAIARFQQAQTIFQQTGDVGSANWMHGFIGWVSLISQDYARAKASYGESLAVALELGDLPWVTWCLMGIGGLATRQGLHEQAARLFGVAEALWNYADFPLPPMILAKYEPLARICRTALGVHAWSEAFDAGTRIPLAQAVDEAREILSAPLVLGSGPPAVDSPYSLTPRESEVLRLLVAGRSDREIATALFLSRRTVQDHVSRLIAKLGVSNRTEVAAVAVREDLV